MSTCQQYGPFGEWSTTHFSLVLSIAPNDVYISGQGGNSVIRFQSIYMRSSSGGEPYSSSKRILGENIMPKNSCESANLSSRARRHVFRYAIYAYKQKCYNFFISYLTYSDRDDFESKVRTSW